jgi:hypothetical protein
LGDSLKAEGLYVFSRILVFATISVAGILPAIRGRDALDTLATHFPLTLLGGSLIPIVVYLRWGWLYPQQELIKHFVR